MTTIAERRPRGERAFRVLIGVMLMSAAVAIVFGLLSMFAGRWGVPFFSFTTDRGSSCTNTLTGYRCDRLTVADVDYWADLTLPAGTTVTSGTYTLTHDYVLTADLEFPADAARSGLKALAAEFGSCQDHPSPLPLTGLRSTCVQANDDSTAQADGSQASRLYLVGSGVRPDGVRVARLSVRSR